MGSSSGGSSGGNGGGPRGRTKIVYDQKGYPMKSAPAKRRTVVEKIARFSPTVRIVSAIANKANLARRKSFIEKNNLTSKMTSMDDDWINSPSGKAEINKLTGGQYDRQSTPRSNNDRGGGGNDNNRSQVEQAVQTEAMQTTATTPVEADMEADAQAETVNEEVSAELGEERKRRRKTQGRGSLFSLGTTQVFQGNRRSLL
jgi:hypothetical protein